MKILIESVTEFKFPIEKPLALITHIIFDMDGLLLDTESMYTIVQQKLLDPFGLEFTPNVKAMMMGRKDLEAAQVMVDHYGLKDKLDPSTFVRDREALLDEMFPLCDLMPGVLRLLLHFHGHQVPMSIATSSHQRHYNLKTRRHEKLFAQVFKHVVTGDQVTQSKPEPEIFMTALNRFGSDNDLDPGKVLVFEDAPLGIKAAVRAGMPVVWVYDEQDPDQNPEAGKACTLMIQNLLHFHPDQFQLPNF